MNSSHAMDSLSSRSLRLRWNASEQSNARPHPYPLPQEEGKAPGVFRNLECVSRHHRYDFVRSKTCASTWRARIGTGRPMILPLLGGEGWGEGGRSAHKLTTLIPERAHFAYDRVPPAGACAQTDTSLRQSSKPKAAHLERNLEGCQMRESIRCSEAPSQSARGLAHFTRISPTRRSLLFLILIMLLILILFVFWPGLLWLRGAERTRKRAQAMESDQDQEYDQDQDNTDPRSKGSWSPKDPCKEQRGLAHSKPWRNSRRTMGKEQANL
jgi:hypothetical protein